LIEGCNAITFSVLLMLRILLKFFDWVTRAALEKNSVTTGCRSFKLCKGINILAKSGEYHAYT